MRASGEGAEGDVAGRKAEGAQDRSQSLRAFSAGEAAWAPGTAEGFEKSDALYHQVLEIDPRYAPAWVELAGNFINKVGGGGVVSNQEGFAPARELAEKALAIDPDYAPAHSTLGYIANLEAMTPARPSTSSAR